MRLAALIFAAALLLPSPAGAVSEDEINDVYVDLLDVGMIERFEYDRREVGAIIKKYAGDGVDHALALEWCFYRAADVEGSAERPHTTFARQTAISVMIYWLVEDRDRALPLPRRVAEVRIEKTKSIAAMRIAGEYEDFADFKMCTDIIASSVGQGV